MQRLSVIERAFELAREGSYPNVKAIRRQLAAEDYSNIDAHTAGITIRRQLKKLIAVAREEAGYAPPASSSNATSAAAVSGFCTRGMPSSEAGSVAAS